MNKEEMIVWLFDKMKSCYPIRYIEYTNDIYWIYDKSYIRKMKLFQLNNIEIVPDFKYTKGSCLFKNNIKSKCIYFNYYTIYELLDNNHNQSYFDVVSTITEIVMSDKFKDYIPIEF